ncbi:amidase [Myriangium duriaei CBS 260.36]|uniref:amidase n=1 Tax=Myriangium duriaei CBS 260.36 TaxID=1168546 RepID=A0A9P4MLA7_9PEZI|nr:amidase [Myriangium duriaei CBS 260.36]
MTRNYLSIAQAKQEQRSLRIPREWRLDSSLIKGRSPLDVPKSSGLFTDRELEITTTYDAVDLVSLMAKGAFTAEEVTIAFCKRAAIAQQVVNCLTEIFFGEAIQRARELDLERQSKPGGSLRPLHGLPISLKDSFKIPGYDSTIGLICFADQPETVYSDLPRMLLDLGAEVLYCKTQVPMTMMTADSDNNVFGRTLNPVKMNLTAGGSSGGEGALIAMRGSVLGIGTDIAGSIRIPSLCNGIYGFRPSVGTVPYSGQKSPAAPGTDGVAPVAGPLATSLRSCTFLLEKLIEAKPWRYDVSCHHLPLWSLPAAHEKKQLRIGIVHNDGVFTPWPPVRRTMLESAAKLRSAGFDVIDLEMPDISEIVSVTYRMFSIDGCKYVQNLINDGKEPQVESVKRTNLAEIPASTLEEYFALNAARTRLKKTFYNFWEDNELDAIIYPPAPTTATKFDDWCSISYTMVWNFLDYPALIIPTGKVNEQDERDDIRTAVHGKLDEHNYNLYTGSKDYHGAPLAVQIVGLHQEDNHLAYLATLIDNTLNDSNR